MKKYDNLIAGTRRYEEKNHIHYMMTNGSMYSALQLMQTVALIFTVGVNILLIWSFLMKSDTLGKYNIADTSFYILTATTIVAIIGGILIFTKYKISASIVLMIPLPLMLYFLIIEYQGDMFSAEFLWRHIIPTSVAFLSALSMLFIAVREEIIFTKNYNSFVSKLYYEFLKNKTDEDSSVNDEEWNKYLQEYSCAKERKK